MYQESRIQAASQIKFLSIFAQICIERKQRDERIDVTHVPGVLNQKKILLK